MRRRLRSLRRLHARVHAIGAAPAFEVDVPLLAANRIGEESEDEMKRHEALAAASGIVAFAGCGMEFVGWGAMANLFLVIAVGLIGAAIVLSLSDRRSR